MRAANAGSLQGSSTVRLRYRPLTFNAVAEKRCDMGDMRMDGSRGTRIGQVRRAAETARDMRLRDRRPH